MRRILTFTLLLLVSAGLAAQQRPLSIDAIYDPDARVTFGGTPPTDLTWIDQDHYQWVRRAEGGGREWLKADASTGRAEPIFNASKMEEALAALPGVSREDAKAVSRSGDLTLNGARTAVLFTLAGDLYFYDFAAGRAVRLTNAAGEEEEATLSPDSRQAAFVRKNNLFVVDVATQKERAITSDGGAQVLNGKLDWLYQEEIYGRGFFRGYWWSPDSARITFLRLDEHPVPEFTVVDHIPARPALEVTDYPNAGDPNPTVKLGTARIAGSDTQWVDLSKYSGEFLIVDVGWSPDSASVVYQVQDREQTWLDLNVAPAEGTPRTLFRETTKAWVNNNGSPIWLKDGSFLWQSERSGFKHLYHYKKDGGEPRQVTNGKWEVRSVYGVDQASSWIYFAGTERSAITQDIYRVKLDGSGFTRLSKQPGRNRGVFNPTFTRYIGYWSDIITPTQVRMHRADGSEERVIDANSAPNVAAYGFIKPEFQQVRTRDGFVMEAMMIKPRNFDPARKYPVFQHTYAGPTSQSVLNSWQGQDYYFLQLLAQNGVLVWECDNRSASGKGAEAQWPVYGRLGEVELQDIEDGIAWLKKQPYVDGSKIILSGWSYGGFMTAYALTHSTTFAAGIIGAPVTDWRNYDSVYTERYMKTPQNNPDGYKRTSATEAAARLNGKALILHGLTDDNVHMQNSVQFAYELQKAGKPFEEMFYPKSRHGITDPRLNKHVHQLMFDFVMRVIKSPGIQ